jgi:hypothetical protein
VSKTTKELATFQPKRKKIKSLFCRNLVSLCRVYKSSPSGVTPSGEQLY